MTFFEWGIIAFIVLSILYHVWRTAGRNPESTGSLGRKFNGLERHVSSIDGRLKHVESDVDELKEASATTEDIEELEKRIAERFQTVAAQLDGQRQLSERTNHSVDRIERILIERSLGNGG